MDEIKERRLFAGIITQRAINDEQTRTDPTAGDHRGRVRKQKSIYTEALGNKMVRKSERKNTAGKSVQFSDLAADSQRDELDYQMSHTTHFEIVN